MRGPATARSGAMPDSSRAAGLHNVDVGGGQDVELGAHRRVVDSGDRVSVCGLFLRLDPQARTRHGFRLHDRDEGAGDRDAVHRLGRRAGDLQEVRPARPELHHLEADAPSRFARSSARPTPSRASTPASAKPFGPADTYPTEAAALKCVCMALMSLDPTGKGRKRWTMRWKAPLNAFQIAFEGRLALANN